MAFNPVTGQWIPSWSTASGFGELPTASLGSEAIEDYLAARTPQEDWANLMADLPADPRWGRGLESLGGRMLGRYYLAEPYIGADEANPDTSFARFMGDIGTSPAYGQNYAGLRARAGLAAEAAQAGQGGQQAYAADPVMLTYYGQFGTPAQGGYERQKAVATMLAQQRGPGLGAYRGRMGDAIARALQSIASSRLASGASESDFLSWYLGETA